MIKKYIMLYIALKILTTMVVVVAFCPSLAHALELPGKMRLSKETYNSIQSIYYPGFTIAGAIGEAGGTILLIILAFLTPAASASFWLTLVALTGLVGMQVVYWLITHPINKFWMKDEKISSFGTGFFSFFGGRDKSQQLSWKELRNRWEYSHVARAGLAFISLLSLVFSLSKIFLA